VWRETAPGRDAPGQEAAAAGALEEELLDELLDELSEVLEDELASELVLEDAVDAPLVDESVE